MPNNRRADVRGDLKARSAASHVAAADAPSNRLLAALSKSDFALIAPQLEVVNVRVNDVLARRGEAFTHIYFPSTAVISLVNRMADGGAVEVGTIGNEGFAGLAAYLEAKASESETFCQIEGLAQRMPVGALIDAAAARPALRQLLNRYTHAYIAQLAQGVACNILHNVEQRCARWILTTHDRVFQAPAILLKQEFLAYMLGVRRASVTIAAGALQDRGAIRYRRGVIRVVDRAVLESSSCECYGVIRDHYDDVMR